LLASTHCRYITEADLEFFKQRVEVPGEVKGAGAWEHMMSKDFGSFTYEAWRRWLSVRAQPASVALSTAFLACRNTSPLLWVRSSEGPFWMVSVAAKQALFTTPQSKRSCWVAGVQRRVLTVHVMLNLGYAE
jgi:hypothetical protein